MPVVVVPVGVLTVYWTVMVSLGTELSESTGKNEPAEPLCDPEVNCTVGSEEVTVYEAAEGQLGLLPV